MSTGWVDGKWVQQAHSFEASCALIETVVRSYIRVPKFKVVKVYIPQLAPAGFGMPSSSPYLFAIAFDAATGVFGVNPAGAGPLVFSQTCTGSDRLLWVEVEETNSQLRVMSATYAAVAMTKTANSPLVAQDDRFNAFYLAAPATGANDVSCSIDGGTAIIIGCSASYSGCAQTGIPDASTTNTGSALTTLTTSLVSVADNCWHILLSNTDGPAASAGTGSTKRGPDAHSFNVFDSNSAKTPAGSVSMTYTTGSAAFYKTFMFSFAPVAIATSGKNFFAFM